jgi:hypothetical protein
MSLISLRNKALSLGATSFDYSDRKNKKYYVVYDGKQIHFGSKEGSTYLDHKDEKKREAWKARHSKIYNKEGQKVITLKTSPSYWSDKILWS